MTIESLQADIATLSVDAIVNAANSSLAGGGGAFSTGAYGFPRPRAAEIAVEAMMRYGAGFERVVACLVDRERLMLYPRLLQSAGTATRPT